MEFINTVLEMSVNHSEHFTHEARGALPLLEIDYILCLYLQIKSDSFWSLMKSSRITSIIIWRVGTHVYEMSYCTNQIESETTWW